MMDRTRSYAGVALDPFATHDRAATARLADVVRQAPTSAEAWLDLAQCHDEQGRTAQAVLSYVRSLMIDRAGGAARGAASRLWKLLVPEFRVEPATTSMKLPGSGGDPWWQAELILATIRSTRRTGKTASMSDEKFFATALQGLMTFLVDLADGSRMSELWRMEAVPYFRAVMTNGYLESMAYLATQPLGRTETARWLTSHEASVTSLQEWAQGWGGEG